MKKTVRLIMIAVVVLSAGLYAAYYFLYQDYPYFQTLRKVKVTEFTAKNIRVTADVVCFNPNKVGATVSDSEFDVYANGKLVSHVKQGGGAKIVADGEFIIPVVVNFSPAKVFQPKDLIGVGFLALKNQNMELRYNGEVKVALAGQDISIPVDYQDDYPLNIGKN
jgi:LEA14-like dessication related protein